MGNKCSLINDNFNFLCGAPPPLCGLAVSLSLSLNPYVFMCVYVSGDDKDQVSLCNIAQAILPLGNLPPERHFSLPPPPLCLCVCLCVMGWQRPGVTIMQNPGYSSTWQFSYFRVPIVVITGLWSCTGLVSHPYWNYHLLVLSCKYLYVYIYKTVVIGCISSFSYCCDKIPTFGGQCLPALFILT